MVTRDDLVEVGVRLLERDGLPSLTLRRIAAAAGVSHGAPRHHFPTYGALLGAVARSGVDDLDARLSPCFAIDDARSAISSAAETYVRFALDRPEMFELMSRHDLLKGQGGELRTVTAGWFASLDDAVTRVVGQRDSARSTALWGGVHGIAVLFGRRTIEPVAAEAEWAKVLAVLVESLLDRPAARAEPSG